MKLSTSVLGLCGVRRGHFLTTCLIILRASLVVDSEFRQPCKYETTDSKISTRYTLNVQNIIKPLVYANQSGCELDISDLFKNISSSRVSNVVWMFIQCVYDEGDSDLIHLTSSKEESKFQVVIVLSIIECSISVNDLHVFKRYGGIASLLSSNTSRIYPDYDCSCLKDLYSLTDYLPCEQTKLLTVGNGSRFFWESCDQPLEKVYKLYLEGCAGQNYVLKQELLQRVFPKLQRLSLKFLNLTKFALTFPWTKIIFNQKLTDFIHIYLSLVPNESKTNMDLSASGSFKIQACDIGDVKLNGNIDTIMMNHVHLKRIKEQTYRNVTSLFTLDLSYNDLEEIEENAFKFQKQLSIIYLKKNKLTFLPNGVFNSQRSLLVLDLSYNEIKTLSRDNFRFLVNLEDINLNFNKITNLPQNFLKDQVYSLKKLKLTGNPLELIPVYPVYSTKLIAMIISHCRINSTGFETFIKSLQKTNLLYAFGSHSQKYDSNHSPGQGQFREKATLDISFNQIKRIDLALTSVSSQTNFLVLTRYFTVNLMGNNLDCLCIYPFGDSLGKIDWVCMYPMKMKGKLVSGVTVNDYYCKVSVANCPKRCSCYQRLHPQTYVVDCRNKNITRLPKTMPDGKLELLFHNANLVNITVQKYFRNTTLFDASHNRINVITSAAVIALTNVSSLRLDHNNLTHLPVQIMSTSIKEMTLGNNPLFCDCHNYWMKRWLTKRTSPVTDWNIVECFYNISKAKQMISVPDSSFVCRSETTVNTPEYVIFSSVVIGCTLFVLVSIALLIYFERFTIKVLLFMHFGIHPFDKQKAIDADVEFDAFVLYSPDEFVFVQKNIIDTLVKKGYTVCNLYKDLVVGFTFLHNIEQIISKSRKVIFSMTEDSFTDDLLMSAWNLAYEKAIKNLNDSIILVVDGELIDKCEDINLKKYIKSGKFIKKKHNILQSSILYLMPKLSKEHQTEDESIEEIMLPMMEVPISCLEDDLNKPLAYISYSDELDDQIRLKLLPELQTNYDVKIFEDELMPGTDIREEINVKLDTSDHFIFILSQETLQDEVKMFILSTVVSKSVLTNENYLLLFTSGNIDSADTSQQLQNYFSKYVTASMAAPDFKVRLLKALTYRR